MRTLLNPLAQNPAIVYFIQMWSLEFVEVADEEKRLRKLKGDKLDGVDQQSPLQSPAKFDKSVSSVSSSSVGGRLDQFKDPSVLKTRITECSSSVDSDTGHMAYAVQNWLCAEKVAGSGTAVAESEQFDCNEDSYGNAERDAEDTFVMDDINTGEASSKTSIDITPAGSGDSTAKSAETLATQAYCADDSPTSGDFCFVTTNDVKDAELTFARLGSLNSVSTKRKLRDGFQWQKQLVFRSKLTMHTAFERKDNKDPAAVTSLAVSRFVCS